MFTLIREAIKMAIKDLKRLLMQIDRSYDAFVEMVLSCVSKSNNRDMVPVIAEYINDNPSADCKDVLYYMSNELNMF